MQFDEFLPSSNILALSIALSAARFENQRWIRARARGYQGSSVWIGFFIDFTGAVSALFGIIFLATFYFDFGWKLTVGLFLITGLAGLIIASVSGYLLRGDSIIAWILGTIIVWPLMGLIGRYVSWFGLFTVPGTV